MFIICIQGKEESFAGDDDTIRDTAVSRMCDLADTSYGSDNWDYREIKLPCGEVHFEVFPLYPKSDYRRRD